MVNLITLADLLVREQHLGYSGNYAFPMARQLLTDAIGLTREQVEATMQSLVSHIEPRARALGLGQASTTELYQQALTQANKELGRVSGQLAVKNRKLQIRAKFFDALAGFQSELRPDAPPQVVLQAIGQTAVTSMEVSSAAVFSLPPGRDYAEAILVDGNGDVFETTIVEKSEIRNPKSEANPKAEIPDLKSADGKPSSGDGPVLTVGPELEWLMAGISPRLANDKRFWICLEADGECIGGVVWGAVAGEAQRLSTQGPGNHGSGERLEPGASHRTNSPKKPAHYRNNSPRLIASFRRPRPRFCGARHSLQSAKWPRARLMR